MSHGSSPEPAAAIEAALHTSRPRVTSRERETTSRVTREKERERTHRAHNRCGERDVSPACLLRFSPALRFRGQWSFAPGRTVAADHHRQQPDCGAGHDVTAAATAERRADDEQPAEFSGFRRVTV